MEKMLQVFHAQDSRNNKVSVLHSRCSRYHSLKQHLTTIKRTLQKKTHSREEVAGHLEMVNQFPKSMDKAFGNTI